MVLAVVVILIKDKKIAAAENYSILPGFQASDVEALDVGRVVIGDEIVSTVIKVEGVRVSVTLDKGGSVDLVRPHFVGQVVKNPLRMVRFWKGIAKNGAVHTFRNFRNVFANQPVAFLTLASLTQDPIRQNPQPERKPIFYSLKCQ